MPDKYKRDLNHLKEFFMKNRNFLCREINECRFRNQYHRSKSLSKTVVTPLLTHWCYYSLALSHRNGLACPERQWRRHFTNACCEKQRTVKIISRFFICTSHCCEIILTMIRQHSPASVIIIKNIKIHFAIAAQIYLLFNSVTLCTLSSLESSHTSC